MPDVAIPLPLSSAPGRVPQESGGRLLNAYAEALGQGGAPAEATWRRVPGLSGFGTATQNICRGMIGGRWQGLRRLWHGTGLVRVRRRRA